MEKQKSLKVLNFYKERKEKLQKEIQSVTYTTTQKEIIQLCIDIDTYTIKILEEYIAGL